MTIQKEGGEVLGVREYKWEIVIFHKKDQKKLTYKVTAKDQVTAVDKAFSQLRSGYDPKDYLILDMKKI